MGESKQWINFLGENMKVKELIAKLAIFDPELEVKIHPESELFIDEDLTCLADVGDIEENTWYWNEEDERYINQKILKQFSFDDTAEKIYAVFIKAIV